MRFIKTTAAALAFAIGATSFVASAVARHRHHHGDALAAGIFGFAAGAILSSALAPRYYYQPAPVYAAPPVIYGTTPAYYAPEPWTSDWYSYCSSRYRSFDPQTGYFLGYDGNYRFCE